MVRWISTPGCCRNLISSSPRRTLDSRNHGTSSPGVCARPWNIRWSISWPIPRGVCWGVRACRLLIWKPCWKRRWKRVPTWKLTATCGVSICQIRTCGRRVTWVSPWPWVRRPSTYKRCALYVWAYSPPAGAGSHQVSSSIPCLIADCYSVCTIGVCRMSPEPQTWYLGTTGWAHRDWVGILYPHDMPPTEYLTAYAQQFNTVEIEHTFFDMPSRQIVQSWQRRAPQDFVFSPCLPRRITHTQRLKDVQSLLEDI